MTIALFASVSDCHSPPPQGQACKDGSFQAELTKIPFAPLLVPVSGISESFVFNHLVMDQVVSPEANVAVLGSRVSK